MKKLIFYAVLIKISLKLSSVDKVLLAISPKFKLNFLLLRIVLGIISKLG